MTPEQLKPIHDTLQVDLPTDMIRVREGIDLRIHEDSRFGFEFFSWRSPDCTQELDCFIKYAKGKRAFVDVGAYHGIFSMVFSRITSGISYAFEPNPQNYKTLVFNSMPENIVCYNVALAEVDGDVNMHEEDGHYMIGGDLQARCFKGDTLFAKHPFVDMMKIDVEGMELSVLLGFSKTITTLHPLIFLELHCRYISNDEKIEIYNMAKGWGYKVLNTDNEEKISLEEILKVEAEIRLILI